MASLVVLVALSYIMSARLALFVGGVLIGAIVRQAALAVHAMRILPALLQVIDWGKVDQLLEEPPRRPNIWLQRTRFAGR